LQSLRQEVVDPAIATHGRPIVKTTGDGLLLEFPSAVNAERRAIEVQTAMAEFLRECGLQPMGALLVDWKASLTVMLAAIRPRNS
jgi:class 3 adenylate cyclase